MRTITSFSTLFLLLFTSNALAHGGRLDANGCHGGSVPYHCHRAPSEMVSSSSGGSRLACTSGSRSKDCYNGGSSSVSSPTSKSYISEPNTSTLAESEYFYKKGSSYLVRSKAYSNVYMKLYPAGHREAGFAVQVPLTGCSTFLNSSEESDIKIVVGSKKMATYLQCTGYKKGNIYPRYVSDQHTLVRLFKDMRQVNLSVNNLSLSFSAMGFTDAYQSLIK